MDPAQTETPRRRAFVVACPVGKLEGARAAARDMAAFLEARGFEVRREPEATHAQLLRGLDWLHESLDEGSLERGDAVVFFYAGHGMALDHKDVSPAEHALGSAPAFHQFLIPMDWRDGPEGPYRVLPSFELTARLDELAALTPNVTAIFDCCHASRIAQDQTSMTAEQRADWSAHIGRQLEDKFQPSHFGSDSGEEIVRLVASTVTEIANERVRPDGERSMVFTDLLLEVLSGDGDDGEPRSWEALLREVQRLTWTRENRPKQRPDVEGARYRAPFTLREVQLPDDVFAARVRRDVITIEAEVPGALAVGDVFELVGGAQVDTELPLATGTLREVTALSGTLALADADEDRAAGLPTHAHAVRVARGDRPRPRVVLGGDGDDAELRDALTSWGFDAQASAKASAETTTLATITTGDAQRVVTDGDGERVAVLGRHARSSLRSALRRLDRWRALTDALRGKQTSPLIRFGRRRDDVVTWFKTPSGFDDCRVEITAGDELVIRVRNPIRDTLYVSVFRVAGDRVIHHWTRDEAAGVPITPGAEGCVTTTAYGGDRGRVVDWPAGLPDNAPAREWLVIALADGPASFHQLETLASERPDNDLVMPASFGPACADYREFACVPYRLTAKSKSTKP